MDGTGPARISTLGAYNVLPPQAYLCTKIPAGSVADSYTPPTMPRIPTYEPPSVVPKDFRLGAYQYIPK